jgi:alkaline phosphatase
VKTRIGVVGVDGNATNCKSSLKSKLNSILKWAHWANKSTGIVTTTSITDATPASAYANVIERKQESFDGTYFNQEDADNGCKDIADQLVTENSFINVKRLFFAEEIIIN